MEEELFVYGCVQINTNIITFINSQDLTATYLHTELTWVAQVNLPVMSSMPIDLGNPGQSTSRFISSYKFTSMLIIFQSHLGYRDPSNPSKPPL